jgi:hypothetical protein
MKWLSLFLICGLLFAPCSALSEQLPSSLVVTLSPDEYAAITQAILDAQEALRKSNAEIATLSRDLKMRSIFCGMLGAALVLDGIGFIIIAIKN